jgi:hypothetical protein
MMKKKHILQSNLYACSRKTKSSFYFWYKVTILAHFRVKTAALSTFYLHPLGNLIANNGKHHDKFVRLHYCSA